MFPFSYRDTQTDESDYEDNAEIPQTASPNTMQSEIESLKEQLNNVQRQLKESKTETAAAVDMVEQVKTEAAKKMDELKRQFSEQLALNKFGLERFGTDNESIRFYTGFSSYDYIKTFYIYRTMC